MQADTQLPTTPPLSGADLVTKLNAIIETLGTNFSGSDDPAAFAWPFATWADTGNMLLKRRNAANTEWVTLGPLLDYHYTRGNVVGTVSQSGGVPTGALIQYGSNSNGEFWRYAGGMQVCTAHLTHNSETGDPPPWTLPATFINGNYRVATATVGTAGNFSSPVVYSKSQWTVGFLRSAHIASGWIRWDIVALGRWY